MDFATTLRILLRRWYVVVPALALTAAGAYLGMQQVTPQYESSGSLVLLGPATGLEVAGEKVPQVNAYLEFGGALATTAEVLSKATLSDASAKKLADAGATGEYEVGTGSDGGSPIINIVATGTSPRIATLTVEEITKLLTAELERRQVAARAPRSQFIRVEVVAPPASRRSCSAASCGWGRRWSPSASRSRSASRSWSRGRWTGGPAARRSSSRSPPPPAPPPRRCPPERPRPAPSRAAAR